MLVNLYYFLCIERNHVDHVENEGDFLGVSHSLLLWEEGCNVIDRQVGMKQYEG